MSTLQSLALRGTRTAMMAVASAVDAMLDVAEPLQDTHALVIGHETTETVRGLIGRGCGVTTEMTIGGRLPTNGAEIVLVPRIGSLDEARIALALARRALLPCGRIVMHDPDSLLAAPIVRLLRTTGFSAIRARVSPLGTIVTADWPMFGLKPDGTG